MVDDSGDNLIFLISQPRAGSTMLQRILSEHPEIYTVAEPWLMLHPFYALKPGGISAEYNGELAYQALQGFIQTLPGKEDDYIQGIRRMYHFLYQRALQNTDKHYFLDKTPRYYFIIRDLYRTFPAARFVFLLRNPLSVLNSILHTWTIFFLYRFGDDLLRAPQLLLEGSMALGEKAYITHYESIVQDPAGQIQALCKWIGVPFSSQMLEYDPGQTTHWDFGDKEGIRQQKSPTVVGFDKWIESLKNPQIWRLSDSYLRVLGRDTIVRLGYSYDELYEILLANKPGRMRLWGSLPLSWWLKKPQRECLTIRTAFARFAKSIQRRGLRETVNMGTRMVLQR